MVVNLFTELLDQRAKTQAQDIAYTFLHDGESELSEITYLQLQQRACGLAATLQQRVKVGERVLLIYPPGIDLIIGFFACLYAGALAVPVYPPYNHRTVAKLQAIIDNCDPSVILASGEIAKNITKLGLLKSMSQNVFLQYLSKNFARKQHELMQWDFERFTWITHNSSAEQNYKAFICPQLQTEQIAFLQYTSGSTGAPKGVMVTHQNLLHNMRVICEGYGIEPNSVVVSWLPPYHDMGLIGTILQSIYVQNQRAILMSPISFLQKPARWLQAVSRYQGNISAAPNFAYDLCVRKISNDELQDVDLSSWTMAVNGAESINPDTIDNFIKRFSPVGFSKNSIRPSYGLAEATLMVSTTSGTNIKCYDRDGLKLHQLRSPREDHKSIHLVSSGVPYQTVRVVDPETRQSLDDRQIGEIWIQSDSVAAGYWRDETKTSAVFKAQILNENSNYLRSGDLGFIEDGELFITGRLKDLIIINGANYYPQDIEDSIACSHTSIKRGQVAAFSMQNCSTEELVIVAEIIAEELDFETISSTIRNTVYSEHQVNVGKLFLTKSKAICKTTSGKIQHFAIRKAIEERTIDAIYQWET